MIKSTGFMSTSSSRDDAATIICIGVAAATLAAVAHETLGHGIGCMAAGGRITLLTSIYFRCLGATPLTDAAGPLGNLFAALLALLLLRMRREWSPASHLFLVFAAGLNAFWFAGQIVYSAVLDTDDLAFVARDLAWAPAWRPLAVLLGFLLYLAGIRTITNAMRGLTTPGEPDGRLRRCVATAYMGAAASAVMAGLLWRGDPWGSAINGFLAVAIAPMGIWVAARRAERLCMEGSTAAVIVRSWPWIVVCLVLFVAFAWTQGRGLGPLA